MDTAKNEYAKVLETIQHIRKQAGGELEIPQICVLGDQSSGKSTWLSSVVSGLKGVLPAGRGTVTLCPIVVHVRCGESRHVVIRNTGQKIQTDTTDWQKTARTALEELMKKVTSSSDSEYEDGYSTSSEGTGQPPIHVSKEEITVEYSAPDVQDLVLVDLPGLIQAGPFVDDIEKMARKYINPVSTLIVITREADLDPDRAAAVRLANEADPDGDRTMVVLTKCDIFSNDEGRKAVLKEISNQNSPVDATVLIFILFFLIPFSM